MDGEHKKVTDDCPANSASKSASVEAEARQAFENLLLFCQQEEGRFREFEASLLKQLFALGCLLVRLFLTVRHERLDLSGYIQKGWRLGEKAAPRILKTVFGKVRYRRAQVIPTKRGTSFHPLDVVLGLTRDGFSPWVVSYVTRLATRMSYASARLMCKAVLNWAPSEEAIEHLVLGLGRQAPYFMEQQGAPDEDGEVLVIEVDGKCPPTATEEELGKRRGRRTKKCGPGCNCQRHRGQAKRRRRGSKKRRKKGDKSKNGKEVMVIVMYTLKRGEDGQLHGPINKKVWATFAGRVAAAEWVRAAATRRGFGPETTKTVQIVMDGAKGLKENLSKLFPNAIFTLDVCHVVERLWSLGRHFHKEASEALKAQVQKWKELVYSGQVAKLIEELRSLLQQVPLNGPGTKGKRKALEKTIGYLEPRVSMMCYDDWRAKDLVIASGQVEGAVRYVVSQRFDCGGMRWIPGRAEALLYLRCIELNGDWEKFIAWSDMYNQKKLLDRKAVRIRSKQPLACEYPLAA